MARHADKGRDIPIRVGKLTDRGITRKERVNQDFFDFAPNFPETGLVVDATRREAKGLLYVVADGMGGHAAGDTASKMAVRALITEYYADPNPDIAASLRTAMRKANVQVYQAAMRDLNLQGMGTTLTAMVLRGNQITVAHVGDSRLYRLRQGQLEQLTPDHTKVQELIDNRVIDESKRKTHPLRSHLTRAVGVDGDVTPFIRTENVEVGDTYLLSSDGLHGEVPLKAMERAVATLRPQPAAQRLIQLAMEAGGPDNITALVVSIGMLRARPPIPPVLLPATLAVAAIAAVMLWSQCAGGGEDKGAGSRMCGVVKGIQGALAMGGATATVITATMPTTAVPVTVGTPTQLPTLTPKWVETQAAQAALGVATDTPPPSPTDAPTRTPRPTVRATVKTFSVTAGMTGNEIEVKWVPDQASRVTVNWRPTTSEVFEGSTGRISVPFKADYCNQPIVITVADPRSVILPGSATIQIPCAEQSDGNDDDDDDDDDDQRSMLEPTIPPEPTPCNPNEPGSC